MDASAAIAAHLNQLIPQAFRTLDKNEYLALVEKLFRAADKDHDGTLDRKELNSWAGRFLLRLFGPRQGPIF